MDKPKKDRKENYPGCLSYLLKEPVESTHSNSDLNSIQEYDLKLFACKNNNYMDQGIGKRSKYMNSSKHTNSDKSLISNFNININEVFFR